MTNNSFKSYANSFQAIARLRLESIECLLNHLGNPQNDLKFIHIAGTNGKGSVCSFLQCIFQDAGYLQFFRQSKFEVPTLFHHDMQINCHLLLLLIHALVYLTESFLSQSLYHIQMPLFHF